MPELAESQQFCLCCPTQGELNLRMNSSVTFNILFEPERKPSITILPNIVNLLLIWDLDFLTGGTWSSLTRGNQLVIFNSIHRYFFEKPQHWVCKRHKSSCWHKTPWTRYFRPLASFYQFLPQRQKWSLRCWRPAEWTKWDTFLRVPLSPLDRPAAKFLAFAKKKIAIISPGDHRGYPLASDRGFLLSSSGLSYRQIPLWKVGGVNVSVVRLFSSVIQGFC